MEAYSKLAETYQSIGDTEAAIESWYQVLRIDPACTDAIEHLRQLNAEQYDLDNIPEYQEHQNSQTSARGSTLMQKIVNTFKNLTTSFLS
jgi:DNA-binding SARP family transcriptional activator